MPPFTFEIILIGIVLTVVLSTSMSGAAVSKQRRVTGSLAARSIDPSFDISAQRHVYSPASA